MVLYQTIQEVKSVTLCPKLKHETLFYNSVILKSAEHNWDVQWSLLRLLAASGVCMKPMFWGPYQSSSSGIWGDPCIVKKAIEIQLHPDSFNRDEGFNLSHTWCPIINMLQWSTGTQMGKKGQAEVGMWLCPQAHSKWGIYTRHWGLCWHIRSLMMRTEMALEISVLYRHLMQLIAWQDFIKFSCHRSFRS
jgi:hypothetical protein